MGFLEIEGLGKIYYHEYGYGDKLLFAFHGYGLNGQQFDVFEKSLLQEYRIVGFDHFFHGTSTLYEVNEAKITAGMQPEFLKAYIENWFKKSGMQQRFSLLGYSIGANMALYLLENFAEMVDEIFLIAPDGLVPHKGFDFLRTSFIGKKLFRKLTYSSWMMLAALNILKQISVIDESLHTIARKEINKPQKRLNAFYTIHFIKNIRPNIVQIAKLINQYRIRCRLYFGEYDNLFPKSNSRNLIKLLDQPELYVLPMDHWLVTNDLDNYLVKQAYDYQQKAQGIL